MVNPIKEIYVIDKIPGLSSFSFYKLLEFCFEEEDKSVRLYNDREVNFKEFLSEVCFNYLQHNYPIAREVQEILDEHGYHYNTEQLHREIKRVESRLTANYNQAKSKVQKKCIGLTIDKNNALWFMFVEEA